MRAAVLSATENRFAVLDGFRTPLPADPPAAARALAAHAAGAIDGLLFLLPPTHGGDCRMVLHNADGSRPEACGNGLRCVAKLAVERGHVTGEALEIETDGGLRRARVERANKRVHRATVSMGAPILLERSALLDTARHRMEAVLIGLGNPHCVLFVEDVAASDVPGLGAELEQHPRFPQRTNVEFVSLDPRGLAVRIWERGVGETASCGSGVTAAAVAAVERGMVRSPVAVHCRGGELRVEWSGCGEALLTGAVGEVEEQLHWNEGEGRWM